MIVFIYGNDAEWINLQVNKKKKDLKVADLTPITFNGNDSLFSMDELLLEISTVSMFDPQKLIIVNNLIGLNTKKVLDDESFNQLGQVLKSPPHDVELFFTLEGNKPDGKRKLTKLFKKHTLWIEEKPLSKGDVNSLINQGLKKHNLNITGQAIDLLKDYCTNYDDVISAFEKLKLVNGEIDVSLIEKLVVDKRTSIIYELSDALIKRDATKTFSIYQSLLSQQIEPTQVIYHLAGKYRQYYQLFTLHSLNYSTAEISKMLKMSDRQAYFLINNHQNLITPVQCLKNLDSLAQIDQDAKRGRIDFKLGLEVFMLKVLN